MPAIASEAINQGPPLSPKLREQIVSATHKMEPSAYTLVDGVNLTVLPGLSEILSESGSRRQGKMHPRPAPQSRRAATKIFERQHGAGACA